MGLAEASWEGSATVPFLFQISHDIFSMLAPTASKMPEPSTSLLACLWLQAYAKNLLGDSPAHSQHHVPWSEKTPRVFWRGSLSAPDNFAVDDIASIPRVRLLNLAREHPDLFDVGITNVETWNLYVSTVWFLSLLVLRVHLSISQLLILVCFSHFFSIFITYSSRCIV